MEIREDLVSHIERFCLLENSIKEKLNNIEEYTEFFQKIVQIKIIEKAFDIKALITDVELEEICHKTLSDKSFREYIIQSIQKLFLNFICEYKGIEFQVVPEYTAIQPDSTLYFYNLLGDNTRLKKEYRYDIKIKIKGQEYTGKIALNIPEKHSEILTKEIIEDNINTIHSYMDMILDKFNAYQHNKNFLENL